MSCTSRIDSILLLVSNGDVSIENSLSVKIHCSFCELFINEVYVDQDELLLFFASY